MDYLHFLRKRTEFLRQLYEDGTAGLVERKRQIEASEAPYDGPGEYESEEPPYLTEWLEAEDAIDLFGHMCIAALAASLQLYLDGWIEERAGRQAAEIRKDPEVKRAFSKGGLMGGYQAIFAKYFGLDWGKAAADLTVLEEIVLTRNTSQHPESITSTRIAQTEYHAGKYPESFFADEFELAAFGPRRAEGSFWTVRLRVTRDKFRAAADEIDRFCESLDQQ